MTKNNFKKTIKKLLTIKKYVNKVVKDFKNDQFKKQFPNKIIFNDNNYYLITKNNNYKLIEKKEEEKKEYPIIIYNDINNKKNLVYNCIKNYIVDDVINNSFIFKKNNDIIIEEEKENLIIKEEIKNDCCVCYNKIIEENEIKNNIIDILKSDNNICKEKHIKQLCISCFKRIKTSLNGSIFKLCCPICRNIFSYEIENDIKTPFLIKISLIFNNKLNLYNDIKNKCLDIDVFKTNEDFLNFFNSFYNKDNNLIYKLDIQYTTQKKYINEYEKIININYLSYDDYMTKRNNLYYKVNDINFLYQFIKIMNCENSINNLFSKFDDFINVASLAVYGQRKFYYFKKMNDNEFACFKKAIRFMIKKFSWNLFNNGSDKFKKSFIYYLNPSRNYIQRGIDRGREIENYNFENIKNCDFIAKVLIDKLSRIIKSDKEFYEAKIKKEIFFNKDKDDLLYFYTNKDSIICDSHYLKEVYKKIFKPNKN